MKLSLRLVLWITIPVLSVGLLLGVAIGRILPPFNFVPALASEEGSKSTQEAAAMPQAISPNDLRALLQTHPNLVLVDARDAVDFAAFHIPGSESMPLGSPGRDSLQVSHDQMIVVYCDLDCDESAIANGWAEVGSSSVRFLRGGIAAWVQAGYPVAR